ncbi:uncharacterized methyltransferase YdaC-like [Haliotis rufescens]|uniref:uncharacterized methyltransferase YdaC-like n=1 Tax=Haliotis rufescens TaxID=6454 RepID=UPI00201E871A|nr:uncharacterized methyltransferase YdaC-like [Haliotis rufescens]XP_046328310.2 uncharacterized methyltransferase YdaC-like [Haliotis rufescens]
MTSRLRNIIAENFRRPQKGLVGNFVSKFVFDKNNVYLEQNAARLSRIQPHHRVLEVGFGTGHGLQEAYEYVKDGTGMIYGIEYSELMLKKASRRMKQEIQHGKVDLCMGSVSQLPYNTDMFDSVFHCNSYYFWPDLKVASQELYRVMKPGSTMVTTINLDRIRRAQSKGFMKYGSPDPVRFMWMLEESGFEDVKLEYLSDGDKKFEAIFARIHEKPAYDEDFEEEVAEFGDLQDEAKPYFADKVKGQLEPSVS